MTDGAAVELGPVPGASLSGSTEGSTNPERARASPENLSEAIEATSSILPRRRWEQPSDTPVVRGANYVEDGKKEPAEGGPVCTLFACQLIELKGDHIAGASAALLQAGEVVPPRSAQTVLTVYFMTPRYAKGSPYHALFFHAAADSAIDDVNGAHDELLRELWSGNAAHALTRCKFLANLRSGPHLVRAVLSWLGLDDTRPMLICRQVHASLNRATLLHHPVDSASAGPQSYQHIEMSFDLAASPLCNQMMRYAWPSLPSVDVALTLVLEGRAPEELPEHHLCSFAIHHADQSEAAAQPAAWPSSERDIPGELHGPRYSGRAASDVGSWQSSRTIISEEKSSGSGSGRIVGFGWRGGRR